MFLSLCLCVSAVNRCCRATEGLAPLLGIRYASDITLGRAVGGSMSFREQLHAYITQLEKRLRWSTILRGLAILTGAALLATLALVVVANALAFSHGSVTAVAFRTHPGSGRCRSRRFGAALAPPHPPARGGHRRRLPSRNSSSALAPSPNAMVRIPSSNFWPAIRSKSPKPPSPSNWSATSASGARSPPAPARSPS